MVSTHSRPKAAGGLPVVTVPYFRFQHTAARRRLDSTLPNIPFRHFCFNTQPPEGGWFPRHDDPEICYAVSTHSRPKAAGRTTGKAWFPNCCFNTQPPEGGWGDEVKDIQAIRVSTHSRPKAAGYGYDRISVTVFVSTHSRPKAAGSR